MISIKSYVNVFFGMKLFNKILIKVRFFKTKFYISVQIFIYDKTCGSFAIQDNHIIGFIFIFMKKK